MKVMAMNGSPRKKGWNTVSMLESLLEGARSAGAETELVQLYDLTFSGCISCFSCKRLARKQDGVCAIQDELTPVLAAIRENCDALVVGTPVYYGCETAGTRAFLERLCFPNGKYDLQRSSLFPRRINTALIYTMNVSEARIAEMGYATGFERTRAMLDRHLGPCELLLATDTLQFSEYDRYESEIFDEAAKRKRHEEVFPQDLRKAYELGARLVG
jgi:multimeric flavodoxin WrbA